MKIKFLFLILFYSVKVVAQTSYVADIQKIIPQTPQAAAFTRYGEYPISPATGIPEINIPLYEVNENDIKVPISFSYHASGIKVEDVSTPVGLGWVLNTGGVITRVVKGVRDLPGHSNNMLKSVTHVQQLINNSQYGTAKIYWENWANGNSAEDIQSDRYVYNFNGKSGVFVYNSANNELTTIPYAPLVIEETVNGFKIRDVDGLVYYFESREVSGPVSSVNMTTTAWYITKIESQVTGASVNYKYKQGSSYSQYVTSETIEYGTTISYLLDPPTGGNRILRTRETVGSQARYNREHIAQNTLLLDEISWGNNKIVFNYATDRLDKYKDRLTSIVVYSSSNLIKEFKCDNNHYWGNTPLNYRMRLDGISSYGENGMSDGAPYTFSYNNSVLLPEYASFYSTVTNVKCQTDYWGYYNGTNSKHFIPNEYCSISGTSRNPNEFYMKALVLTEIKYPTGGRTLFDYEANKVSNAYDYKSTESVVGGLRIKRITSKVDGKETYKEFEYTGKPMEQIRQDMFKYSKRKIYTYKFNHLVRFDEDWDIYVSTPLYSLTAWSSSPVFYNTVTEFFGTSASNTGKKVSRYRENVNNGLRYSFGSNVKDTDIGPYWNAFDNIEQGLYQPLLEKEEFYENRLGSYILKRDISHSYSQHDKGKIITGVRLAFRDSWIHDPAGGPVWDSSPYPTWYAYFNENMVYYDVEAYRHFLLLGSTTTTDYFNDEMIKSTVFYSYDTNYRTLSPISTSTTNSDGTILTHTRKFAFNETTAPYTEMIGKNIIDLDFGGDISNGKGESYGLKKEFRKERNHFVIDLIKSGKNGVFEHRFKYLNYDMYFNPREIIRYPSEHVVYLWGYGGKYPIAEIKNATYEEVKIALDDPLEAFITTIGSKVEPSISDFSKLAQLRSRLPRATITTFTYKPLVGMTSMTDPRGITEYYQYDGFQRLKEVLDFDKNLLQNYHYHYKP